MLDAVAGALLAASACHDEPPPLAPATVVPIAPVTSNGDGRVSSIPVASSRAAQTAPVGPPVILEQNAEVPIFSDDPQWGDRKSPALVVFVDLQCPHCAVFHKQLVDATRTPSVRIVWKHFPLASHPAARPAAEAAQGVYMLAGGDAFAAFVDKVFSHQGSPPSQADYVRWAHEVGVKDMADYLAGLRSKRWAPTVDRDHDLAEKLQVLGTPTLYIDGAVYRGTSDADLSSAIANGARD